MNNDHISSMSRVCDDEFGKVMYIFNHYFFRNKRICKLRQILRRFKWVIQYWLSVRVEAEKALQ